MNQNTVITDRFSNPESERRFDERFADEPSLAKQCFEDCHQCGGCAFFAPFNLDYGLCCHPESRHYLETVYEHFTCGAIVVEDWGAHSFGLAVDARVEPDPGVVGEERPKPARRPWWRFWGHRR